MPKHRNQIPRSKYVRQTLLGQARKKDIEDLNNTKDPFDNNYTDQTTAIQASSPIPIPAGALLDHADVFSQFRIPDDQIAA